MKRSVRRKIDTENATTAKLENRKRKTAERTRRDARMADKVRAGSLPYAPAVMSWLSRKLDKRAVKISSEDVNSLLT